MVMSILVLFLTSCSPGINWVIYNDPINNFEIKYPEKWTETKNGNAVLFASPLQNEKDVFQENVNIILQDLSTNPIDLEKYTVITKKQVIDHLGPSAIIPVVPGVPPRITWNVL